MLWWKFGKFLVSFLKAEVSFPSNFVLILSANKHNSSILSKLKHYILWSYFSPLIKCKFLRFLSALNWQVNSSSNFASFFIVITLNSPVNFKLMHFPFWIKEPNKSPNFETFVCCSEHLPNTSCHFPNHKSVYLQILHHSLVSWNITPLYFLTQILHTVVKSSALKCKFLRLSSSRVKIRQIS